MIRIWTPLRLIDALELKGPRIKDGFSIELKYKRPFGSNNAEIKLWALDALESGYFFPYLESGSIRCGDVLYFNTHHYQQPT